MGGTAELTHVGHVHPVAFFASSTITAGAIASLGSTGKNFLRYHGTEALGISFIISGSCMFLCVTQGARRYNTQSGHAMAFITWPLRRCNHSGILSVFEMGPCTIGAPILIMIVNPEPSHLLYRYWW